MAIGFVGQLGGAGGSAGAASAINYGAPVQDTTALRAVPPALRDDKQQRLVEDKNAEYRFDTAGAGVDDDDLIIVPDTGTGRWFKITPSGGIPSAHAASHAENASDEILVEDVGTAETDTALALMVDGTGGLLFGSPAPAAHALGGALHTADTLANLNTKISDAKIDEFFQFNADQLDNPNNADWAVNALAPAVADSNNNGLTVRAFDDTTEEGVGFSLRVPPGATNLKIAPKGRPETGPPAARTVGLKLYQRGVPDDAAPEAWSAGTVLTDIDIPTTTEFFQYDAQTITLASLGITAGELTQFELTRVDPAGGTELVGDWDLLQLEVGFS